MDIGPRKPTLVLCYLVLLGAGLAAGGCAPIKSAVGVPQWTGSGSLDEAFLQYRSVAVLPFEGDPKGEVSDTFARKFRGRFPQMATAGRRQVLEKFAEGDLYYGRLDGETRAEIRKTFGVQAVVMGSVYYMSIVRWLLQVVIVDVERDTVLGRSYVEINYIGAEGMEQGCELALRQLVPR